eukprot:sb/3463313/
MSYIRESLLFILPIFTGHSDLPGKSLFPEHPGKLGCLRSYRDHWGVVSGTLLAVGFGATSIIHIWEGAMVNPLNINPVKLSGDQAISEYWYYESETVLDKCGEFYVYLGIILLLLLLYPVIVYRIYPDPGPSIDEHLALETCFKTTRSITTDPRFLLAFTSFSFSGASSLHHGHHHHSNSMVRFPGWSYGWSWCQQYADKCHHPSQVLVVEDYCFGGRFQLQSDSSTLCTMHTIILVNLYRCLRSYRDHWGVVSGTLLAVGFGATSIIHIWEGAMVNPLNINPVKLSGDQAISEYWYYESETVLDKCGEFYVYLGIILLLLLLYPVIVYRIYPDPGPSIDEHLALETCFKTTRSITTDPRFLLAFTSFSFSGVSGMCARSSLKTFGESFINDERYLSSVGGSGSFGAAVGALSMGLIMDMAIGSGGSISGNSPKLLLFNAFLCLTGTAMLMFADKMGKIWYLFSYDVTLLAFGGASSVMNMVLLEIFGISKFSIAFGITSLSTFFSGLWFTIASFSKLTWHDFWLAISLFSSLAVATAFGLYLEYRSRGGRIVREVVVVEGSSSAEEDEDDYIWHNGKKYVRQK